MQRDISDLAPRSYAPWTKAEVFTALSRLERAALPSVARRLGRTPAAVEQRLYAEGVSRNRGLRTPTQVSHATGYHWRTIKRVAMHLGLGRATSKLSHARLWLRVWLFRPPTVAR